jgi:hypothetical protein
MVVIITPTSSSTTMTTSSTTEMPMDSCTTVDFDCNDALEQSRMDAIEAGTALENLVEGMKAVKRILESPPLENKRNVNNNNNNNSSSNNDNHDGGYDKSIGTACRSSSSSSSSSSIVSTDVKLISALSEKLIGVLGSELIGLMNAAEMTKGYKNLHCKEDSTILKDLRRAKKVAVKANHRADKAEKISRRLYDEKQCLIQEVQRLRNDRTILVKEVKSLRRVVKHKKKFYVRASLTAHESLLKTSSFTGSTTNDKKIASMLSNKENLNNYVHLPRIGEQSDEQNNNNNVLRVVRYAKSNELSSPKSTITARETPPTNTQQGPNFPAGISLASGFDRFKKTLSQSGQMYHDLMEDAININTKKNNCKSIDDKATKSMKSCSPPKDEKSLVTDSSFETDPTASMNSETIFSTTPSHNNSMLAASYEKMPNDLVFQISIDGSSFNYDITSPLKITPESSPLKRMCNPNVLRTLAISNGDRQVEVGSSALLRPRSLSTLFDEVS